MTPPAPPRNRLRSTLASNAPVAFLLGLVVLGVSALLLGVLATEGDTTVLDDRLRMDRRDDLVALSYLVPPYAPDDALLEVTYAFPHGPGDVYVLDCADLERVLQRQAPRRPLVALHDAREGAFSEPMDNYLGYGWYLFDASGDATGAGNATSGGGASSGGGSSRETVVLGSGASVPGGVCGGVYVSFVYAQAAGADDNRPQVEVRVREVPLDGADAIALFALSAVSGLLALAGGLEWQRRRRAASPAAGADEGAGTAETLRRLAERSEAWLARTRRYVLISGPLGIFLWYPVLIPWAWRAGREGSGTAWMPWALAGGALLFLAGLTTLWAREALRLDRELKAWREQLAELRRREEALLAELDG